MRTVTFYSYKGGVGRTLLLANMAAGLGRLGKRVLCLDLDLEAPGLHYKLLDEAMGNHHSRGVLDLLSLLGEPDAHPDINDYVVQTALGVDLLTAVPLGEPSETHWRALSELNWRGDEGTGLLTRLVALQVWLENVADYDYLLIDARTGVTDVGAIATTVLAGTVVACTLPTQECLDGTAQVYRALADAPQPVMAESRELVPVVTRIPVANDFERLDQSVDLPPHAEDGIQRVSASLDLDPDDPRAERLSLVREDRDIQAHETVVMARSSETATGLYIDYLGVLKRLLSPGESLADLIDPLLGGRDSETSDDVFVEVIAQLAMVEATPQLLWRWVSLVLSRDKANRGKLSISTVALAAALHRISEDSRKHVCSFLVDRVESGISLEDPLDDDIARALEPIIPGIGLELTSEMGPLGELLVEMSPGLPSSVNAAIAEIMVPWDRRASEQLIARAGDDHWAAGVRATLARLDEDNEAEFGYLLEAVRGGLSMETSAPRNMSRSIARQIPRAVALVVLSGKREWARALLDVLATRDIVPAEHLAAVAFVAGNDALARLWFARALGRTEVEANEERRRRVEEPLRRAGGSRLVDEVVATLGGARN